ncbi:MULTISPECIES: GNAT family N-acetyltransferase [Kitasatospora]|uniref:N-acetyltransferase domain-containing protein n=1 Tax=Kitasatospora cystarginea TaxID=58350 RepID=A0ABN3E8B4_9ACTN
MLSAPPPLYVRAAVPADLDRLAALRTEAAAWIARQHGSRQWSDPFDATRSLVWIERAATVVALLEPDGEPVATVTDRPTGSRLLWTPQELADPARYFSRFIVDRRYAGRGIGAHLTDWARWRAAGAGAELVRTNAWSDNAGLHAYYRAHGWQWVRTVTGNRSGALFEMAVRRSRPRCVHELGEIPLLR